MDGPIPAVRGGERVWQENDLIDVWRGEGHPFDNVTSDELSTRNNIYHREILRTVMSLCTKKSPKRLDASLNIASPTIARNYVIASASLAPPDDARVWRLNVSANQN